MTISQTVKLISESGEYFEEKVREVSTGVAVEIHSLC